MRAVTVFGLALALLLPLPSARAESPEESVEALLAELEFERALDAVETLLADPSLAADRRLAALVLRAKVHTALGDLDGVEQDYREILAADPRYRPDETLTPAKVMQRYEKIRAKTVGIARIDVQPQSAGLTVDGRAVELDPNGTVPLPAGERVLRAEARGHDAQEVRLDVEAGAETAVTIRLLPNARTIVVRTDPPGVRVRIDGEAIGETRRVASAPTAPGVLVVEDLPLGEHTIELTRRCYAPHLFRDMLSADLLHTAPKEYETARLAPARTLLALTGGPAGGEVLVDGEPVGVLPLEPLSVCPGESEVEVRVAGRGVWYERLALTQDRPETREIRPRPNAVLLGAESWPPALAPLAEACSTRSARPLPERGFDPARGASWATLTLAPDTDLVVAMLPGRRGEADSWWLFSPVLGTAEPVDPATTLRTPPRPWEQTRWGLEIADSGIAGPAVVVSVETGAPAASAGVRVGERIVAVAGSPVEGAAEARRVLAAATPGVPTPLRLLSRNGSEREVELTGLATPRLLTAPAAGGLPPDPVLAARASVDAAADPRLRPTALANLALLLSRHGRNDRAAEVWKRVRWGERPGVGDGTAAYYLGRELLHLGREHDAAAAFRRAAASEATTPVDAGDPVAPAARDHLSDLGVDLD